MPRMMGFRVNFAWDVGERLKNLAHARGVITGHLVMQAAVAALVKAEDKHGGPFPARPKIPVTLPATAEVPVEMADDAPPALRHFGAPCLAIPDRK